MERVDTSTPTFSLSSFQGQKYEITNTARDGAEALEMDVDDIEHLVSSMDTSHFYKSMSTKKKNVWQDVYHVPYNGKIIYLKVSTGITCPFCIVQLKEK